LIAVCESEIFSQWQERRAEERRNAVLKKIWNIVTTVVVCVVALLALLLVGARILGLQTYVVLSGSMEPDYPTGSLIYVREVDRFEVQPKDVITFMINETTVATHRVVAVDGENRTFTTKGDANRTADAAPVHFNNLVGKPVFSIPFLGYVAHFVQNPPGKYVAIGLCVLLLASSLLSGFFKKEEPTGDGAVPPAEGADVPADQPAEAAEAKADQPAEGSQEAADKPAEGEATEGASEEDAKSEETSEN
jgi:signal peptidase